MIVNAIKNHQPERLMSWSRLIATANPGMNRTREEIPFRTATPIIRSKVEVTSPTNSEKTLHHQYSDLLDLVRKSRYLRKPDATDSVKLIGPFPKKETFEATPLCSGAFWTTAPVLTLQSAPQLPLT